MRRAAGAERIALATAGLLAMSAAVERDRVGPTETRIFRSINDLPDCLNRWLWPVMQLGALGAAPAAAALAWAKGERRLAAELLVAGSSTWGLSKVVKRMVGRPRPALLIPGTRVRGTDASGLGYLSGHAGVSVALAVAALPRCTPSERALIATLVPLVGLARMYVGAHLPMDVAAGAVLGVAVEAAVRLLLGDDR